MALNFPDFSGIDLDDPRGRSTLGLALRDLLEVSTGAPGSLTPSEQDELVAKLPRLTEDVLPDKDDSCPICFTPFLALLAEEETAIAMDSPAHPLEYSGVTKLSREGQCGHIFCRRDITKWIEESHNSCPMCRHTLVHKEPEESSSPDLAQPVPAELTRLQAELANSRPRDVEDPGPQFREAMASLIRPFLSEDGEIIGEPPVHEVVALMQSYLGPPRTTPGPAFQEMMNGSGVSTSRFFGGGYRTEQPEEDRSEFSGMYS